MQEADGSDIQKKVIFCFRVMSRCFTDPAEAEENFQILDQLKDSNIWKLLTQLLDPNTSSLQASSLRVRPLFDVEATLILLSFTNLAIFVN